MEKRKILFRTDAGINIGYGHFIRTLALADMLKEQYQCILFTQSPSDYQKKEVSKVCELIALPDSDEKYSIFLDYLQGDEIVVLDNYFYSTEYQQQIKDKGCKLVCIDDIHDKHYVADVVINHSLCASPEMFDVEPYTRLCLGISYSLLRAPFLDSYRKQLCNSQLTVFICFGGLDHENLTMRYLQALYNPQEMIRYNVVIGDGYLYKEDLLSYSNGKKYISVYDSISASEMANVISTSKIAIVSASTIMKEALFMGLDIFYGYYVENQKGICECMGDNDTYRMHCLGDLRIYQTEFLKEKILEVARASNVGSPSFKLPDVKKNILNLFEELDNYNTLFGYGVTLRRLTADKIEMVRQWRNDPKISKYMGCQDYITKEQQEVWFKRISNKHFFYYIIEVDGKEVGLNNLSHIDYDNKTAVPGIFIYDDYYKSSLLSYQASLVLDDFAFNVLKLDKLLIHVLKTNKNANRFNKSRGCVLVEDDEKSDFYRYTLSKEDYFKSKEKIMKYLSIWNK